MGLHQVTGRGTKREIMWAPLGKRKWDHLFCRKKVLDGLSQPLPCFRLHLGTRLTKLLEINYKKKRGIVRLTIEWFLSRENNPWLILIKTFRWKIKWRLEHLGALGIVGEAAL